MKADDRVLIGLAVAVAFAAGISTVASHAQCMSAGYELAVARREGVELGRGVAELDRRVSSLKTPQAATARIAPMKLTSIKYPRSWNVVSAATLRSCLTSADPATPVPSRAAGGTAR